MDLHVVGHEKPCFANSVLDVVGHDHDESCSTSNPIILPLSRTTASKHQ